MHQSAAELSFDEQTEFNQAVLQKIQTKLPAFTSELEHLKQSTSTNKPQNDEKKELQVFIIPAICLDGVPLTCNS